MKIKNFDQFTIKSIAYFTITIFALIALIPFVAIVISSFTSEKDIITKGYSLIPESFSLDAYKLIFQNPRKIANAYGVSVLITVVGTIVSLYFSTMTAFVLFRKEVRYRSKLAFFLYFTELFHGGLASYYIVVSRMLHLKNSIAVLLLVPLFSVFNILILRNFLNSIPYSLIESSKIDGANDFSIFMRIALPLSKPALASIGLFTVLIYWNDWWTAMMFVDEKTLYPLQYVLYLILNSTNMASNMVENVPRLNMPKESLKLAMVVVSIGPMMFIYPFVQKYFVKGITIGAVKG